MHQAALDWVAAHAPEGALSVVDIGGRDINGNPEHLFDEACTWEVVDLFDGPRVTHVGDVLEYRPKRLVDVVLCLEVAEHAEGWRDIVAHASSMLKKRGTLILTAASPSRDPHSAVDGGALPPGEFYKNIDPTELAKVLRKSFRQIDVDELGDDVRAVATR